MTTPTIGRIVHYVAPGSADGTYPPAHRAAIVTEIPRGPLFDLGIEPPQLNLCILNPTGMHFALKVDHDDSPKPGPFTWHWPEEAN